MIDVESALAHILAKVTPLARRRLPLLETLGCVLAEDIFALEPLPPFTNSAMDGYAVRRHNSESRAQSFEVIDTVPAGKASQCSLAPGQAARIMTGAPIPAGADAVVPVEEAEDLPNSGVRFSVSIEPGQHIRPQGEETKIGDRLLKKGRTLKPADLGLLASMGLTQVAVVPRPRVSVFTTGSEVVDPSVAPGPGQIRNSNLTAIVSSVLVAGGVVDSAQHVADDPSALESALSSCESDVIITCGGVSVGDYDFVKPVLAKLGEIYFWKVAIKPGKPFVFGRIGSTYIFGLPGNPVSALVAFEVLVRPALHALAGFSMEPPLLRDALLAHPIHHKPGRREFVRARISQKNEDWIAEPLPWQGSGMLRSLTEANGWVVIPEVSNDVPAGSRVQFMEQRVEP